MQRFKEKVIHWKKLGRTIWFPTANLKLKKDFIDDGTYKVNIVYSEKIYSWVWAARNTLKLFEAHIFDFDKEIYGEELEIIVLEKLRENKKFDSLEKLKKQIEADVEKAKKSEIIVMNFWTFDIFHPGHKFFLFESRKYGDKLITIIARDENVEKLKWSFPKNSEDERLKEIEKSKIPDKVLLWDKKNPLKWIDFYKPRIIALWYDQVWFSKLLHDRSIEIIRIWSYKKEIYKSSKIKKIF